MTLMYLRHLSTVSEYMSLDVSHLNVAYQMLVMPIGNIR